MQFTPGTRGEGRTLREALAHGPLPLRRVLDLGAQIALSLAAAHDRGVIHRDIKPENVFITPEGLVTLLDFGLAHIASDPCAVFAEAETAGQPAQGSWLGSMGYMSPEQVSGSEADQRSDVFSLGVVLFEMLTRHLPFQRASAVETWNATLKEGPLPITAFRSGVPCQLARIVMRCLENSPAERFQSARDVAFALSQVGPSSAASTAVAATIPELAVEDCWWFSAAVGVIVGLWLLVVLLPGYRSAATRREQPLVTFIIPPPPNTTLADVPSRMLAMSPNGDRLVFAVTMGGHRKLWIRELASTKAEPLAGTEDASEPFWSPDGHDIGFFAESKLKRVGVTGTTPMTLCDAPLEARGGTWSDEGQILFADAYGGLSRVAATGGVPARVTTPAERPTYQSDSWPQFLPDARRFLYLRQAGPGSEVGATAYLGMLTGERARELVSGVFNALFVAPNRILFTDAAGINVQRVDLDRAQISGEREQFSADIDRRLGHAALSVSRSGTLAYAAAGSPDQRLAWFDRKGQQAGVLATIDMAQSNGAGIVVVLNWADHLDSIRSAR